MKEKVPKKISKYIDYRNSQKQLFTAGPASLIEENITGLRPCFGRGDKDYTQLEESVLNKIKTLSGHKKIVRLQGSASLALEIITLNFLYGKVLIISTGFYSDRLIKFVENAKRISCEIKEIKIVPYNLLNEVNEKFDWIVSCYTETSRGFKISIKKLKMKANSLKSKIMLDATASIGLENDHHLADVIGFSSCKGLFGLTGAAFITYNQSPSVNVNSFYLDINSHINKSMTGPYHSICSLYEVLKKYNQYRSSVVINKNIFLKKFSRYIDVPEENQPLLCTYTTCEIIKKKDNVVLYAPRGLRTGSIVCHLGEVHLSENSKGDINKSIDKVN